LIQKTLERLDCLNAHDYLNDKILPLAKPRTLTALGDEAQTRQDWNSHQTAIVFIMEPYRALPSGLSNSTAKA
jgi:hypothetical protein